MTDAPQRIQLRRTKGWRMPENTVKVDRTTMWGNPFQDAALASMAAVHVGKRGDAAGRKFGLVALFANWITEWPKPIPILVSCLLFGDMPTPPSVEEIRVALRGKNLACWCRLCPEHSNGKPFGADCPDCSPCHSDVLGPIANAPLKCEAVSA